MPNTVSTPCASSSAIAAWPQVWLAVMRWAVSWGDKDRRRSWWFGGAVATDERGRSGRSALLVVPAKAGTHGAASTAACGGVAAEPIFRDAATSWLCRSASCRRQDGSRLSSGRRKGDRIGASRRQAADRKVAIRSSLYRAGRRFLQRRFGIQ